MVSTGHQKSPKMGQSSMKSPFFARRAKKTSAEGRSPPQELEIGPHSGPYLLVLQYYVISEMKLSCGPNFHTQTPQFWNIPSWYAVGIELIAS